MGGWEEEVFYSRLRVGLTLEAQGKPFSAIRSALLDAWEYRPTRAEPLCHLARLCRSEKKWHQAYLYAAQAVQIPYPQQDLLFVDDSVWHWRALDEQAIAAYWTGRFRESGDCCQRLLEQGLLPEAEVQRVRSNLRFAEEKAG